ncbi:hypothetical protein RAA17_24865 [Komagataeibacter rhaeticus]|nr:hypothetical protein [Komagataeibacter rhaeticus]
MKFASTRLIAADINTMVAFYELVTEQPAEWLAPQFAEIVTPGATLAIGSAETVALFREGTAEPGQTAPQFWNSGLMTWMPYSHA